MDNYASLTLIEIRRYLSYTYQPQHSWAHIPSQIATYTTDQSIMSIIEQLEHSEYTHTDLSRDEKEATNRELNMKMGKQ
jgi:hypothetical protein